MTIRRWNVYGLVFLLAAMVCFADTWQLGQAGQWQSLSDDPNGAYVLAINDVNKKIATGDPGALEGLKKLKQDFKDVNTPEIDAFIEAMSLYVKKNWSKATKKLQEFVRLYPESVFYPSAEEQLFSIGTAFLNGQNRNVLWILWLPAFDEGVNIMRDVADRAGTTPMGYRTLLVLAESYEKREKFVEAYLVWSEMNEKWPTGEIGQRTLLRMAQSVHAAYRGPKYDSSWLNTARTYDEELNKRYPQQASQLNVPQTIDMIVEQEAYKKFTVARYYENADHLYAGTLYYDAVLKGWPDSQSAEMARQAQAKVGPFEPKPKSVNRKLFDAGNVVLDSWFGIGYLFGKPGNQESEQG